jgi:signal transduction histidine kinase
VLAHNISMINVQAGVALHLLDERPEQARPALTAIKQASKEALIELRSVLGVLRRVDEEDGSRDPTPTLGRLDDLVARTQATGLSVRLRRRGDAVPLPAPVDVAAFRIVQEGLTNVLRHAAATTATVEIAYVSDALTVLVDDDGGGSAAAQGSPGGRGIVGMRERAESVGGSLEAGPRPGGGFRVRARLPLEEASP